MPDQCKVDRVAEKHRLYNIDERLVHRYKNEDEGVRRLETWLNQQILRRAMEQAGMTVLDGSEAIHHRLLTADDVRDSQRREVKRKLRNAGVDIEQVERDFVSYRTVLTHLKECIGIDTSRRQDVDVERDRGRISKIQSRVRSVCETSLQTLRKHDAIHIDDPRVNVTIRVRCDECNRTHDVIQFLSKRRKCPCKTNEGGRK